MVFNSVDEDLSVLSELPLEKLLKAKEFIVDMKNEKPKTTKNTTEFVSKNRNGFGSQFEPNFRSEALILNEDFPNR